MKRGDLFTFINFYVSWLIISSDLSFSSLVTGAVLSYALAAIIKTNSTKLMAKLIVKNFLLILIYLAFLMVEAFLSSCRIAYLTLHPKLPLKPGIIKVSSNFDKDNKVMAMTLLANSITLTPGTLTIDLDINDQSYYIHWIDINTSDEKKMREEIFGPIEAIIRRIFK